MVTGLICSFRDIGDRSEPAEQQPTSIVESSDDALVSKNLDGIIMSWNKGAERLFGYTAAEVVGQSIAILIPIGAHQRYIRLLKGLVLAHIVISRATFEAPIILPLWQLSPEQSVRETFRRSVLAHANRLEMLKPLPTLKLFEDFRFFLDPIGGIRIAIDWPTTSAAVAKQAPAPLFQLTMMPFRSLLTIASSDDSTMDASRLLFCSRLAFYRRYPGRSR